MLAMPVEIVAGQVAAERAVKGRVKVRDDERGTTGVAAVVQLRMECKVAMVSTGPSVTVLALKAVEQSGSRDRKPRKSRSNNRRKSRA